MRKMLLMCAVALAALTTYSAEVWRKCPVDQWGFSECDWYVTIDGVRWSVLQSGTTYRLGTYVLDYSIVPWDTSGDIIVPSALRGSSVTEIPGAAFYGCDKITSISIHSSVSYIGGYETFQGCGSLTNFIVASGNTSFCAQDGCLLSKDKTCLVSYPRGKKGAFVIPFTVTSIAEDAASTCYFESAVLHEGVTSIGRASFAFNENLQSVILPQSLQSISVGAFMYCTSLKTLTLFKGVKSIEYGAFENCSALTSVTIPSSVTSIGENAFLTYSDSIHIDFEGEPPTGVNTAGIEKDAAIRYNVAHEAEWLPVIEQCGWTNATPYLPKPCPEGGPYKEVVEGIEWTFMVTNGQASVGTGEARVTAVPTSTTGAITIPSSLGGRMVTDISAGAFCNCTNITSVVIPDGIEAIGSTAFFSCTKLMCATIPSSVKEIWSRAFARCYKLTDLYLADDVAPQLSFAGSIGNHFDACNWDLIMHVPSTWKGRGRTLYGYTVFRDGEETDVRMTVTNVVVHYIQTSELSPMAAPITPDVGIVNVMTEIEGGIVAVPESWATNYPSFKQKFGDDFAVALTRETGKFDANRKPMYVWQDYVAGTDPTNVEDQFRASVTMVGGKPVISFTPVLSEKEAAKRVYTTYGKVKLQDAQWEVITAGAEDNYNFFKVTVKMK